MIRILYQCDLCKKTVEEYESEHSNWEHPIGTGKLNEVVIDNKDVELCTECFNGLTEKIKEYYQDNYVRSDE